jgi:LAO/AO transport system kinase
MYALLQLPNAGDDLQAIKKGVMELADIVVINKADIDQHAATRAQAQIASSLRLLGMHHRSDHVAHDETQWHAEVMQLSALKADGIDRFWSAVTRFRDLQAANGRFARRRSQQSLNWMWDHIHAELRHRFSHHPAVQEVLADTSRSVAAGQLPASAAARGLLARFALPA